MKKTTMLKGLIGTLALIFAVCISGCKSSDPLVGVWVDENYSNSGYIFYEDGTGYSVSNGQKRGIWWRASENSIHIETDSIADFYSYRFSDDKDALTIRFDKATHVSTITYNRADSEDVFE